jgi:HD-GYP domain-containing protein (c-di-GMP phosphodiesterase class II)
MTAKQASPRRPRKRRQPEPVTLSAAEVFVPLSRALDLTEGHPFGHAMRACMIGMRLGQEAPLDDEQRAALYYALLLKDAGGSSNSARTSALFGSDDHRVKPRMKFVEWTDRKDMAVETWRNTAMRGSFRSKVSHLVGMVREENVMRSLVSTRSERGAEIASRLGFSQATVDGIRALDERWNGNGYPKGQRGDSIPLFARIASIAQTVDIFVTQHGREETENVLRARRGEWFDPSLADAAIELLRDDEFREAMQGDDLDARVIALEPVTHSRRIDDDGLDRIALAFADIVDAKSPYTHRHSTGVAEYTRAIGKQLGFDEQTLRNAFRAGLLHDIGNLGVSSRILEKTGSLNKAERAEIANHPVHTWEILRQVPAFSGFAMQAATHHEKLDGSGYPWGRTADDLDALARALVVADVFEAALANRAYRAGVSIPEAMQILNAQRGLWLDPDAVDALAATLEQQSGDL